MNDRVITFSPARLNFDLATDALEHLAAAIRRSAGGIPAKTQHDLLRDGLEQLVERQLILRSFDFELPPADGVVDQLVQDRIRDRFGGDRITFIENLPRAQGEHSINTTAKKYRTIYRLPRCFKNNWEIVGYNF